jgi:chromate transporter
MGGIRVCVCVLILNAVVKLFKKSIVDLPTLLIFLGVLLCSVLTPLSPVLFVVLAAVLGIVLKVLGLGGKKA